MCPLTHVTNIVESASKVQENYLFQSLPRVPSLLCRGGYKYIYIYIHIYIYIYIHIKYVTKVSLVTLTFIINPTPWTFSMKFYRDVPKECPWCLMQETRLIPLFIFCLNTYFIFYISPHFYTVFRLSRWCIVPTPTDGRLLLGIRKACHLLRSSTGPVSRFHLSSAG